MSDSNNNPDKAHGNQDNSTDKTETKREIYDRLRKFSTLDGATILQVDSTVIVGVLFFLTLISFFGAEEGEGRLFAIILTIAIIGPFSVSAIVVLISNLPLQRIIWSFLTMKRSPQPMNEKDKLKMVNYSTLAVFITFTGFLYLLGVLGLTAVLIWDNSRDIQDVTQDCGGRSRTIWHQLF